MELGDAILGRRSIREYYAREVPMDLVKQVLEAATWAPSAKNEQQWRFTVLSGVAKSRFTGSFRRELQKTERKIGRPAMGSAYGSCDIMEQAPVLIIVWNAGTRGWETEIHSVAAAIQNMLLKAFSLGLGSLWIGDIFYASDAVRAYFGKLWRLMAAVSIGWPANSPLPKTRKFLEEVAEFMS